MTPDTASTLGQTIRSKRLALNLTLRDVAAVAGKSIAYLHDLEHDRRGLSDETLERLSNALQLDQSELRALSGQFSVRATALLKRCPEFGVMVDEMARTWEQEQKRRFGPRFRRDVTRGK